NRWLDDSGGWIDYVECRKRQRDAVRKREARCDLKNLPYRSTEQHQADNEQDVVRTNEDVMNPGDHELLNHRKDALRATDGKFGLAMGAVEDLLPGEISILIETHVRLVPWIVRKQPALDSK